METKEIFTEGDGEAVIVCKIVCVGGVCTENVKTGGTEGTEEIEGVEDDGCEECSSNEVLDDS